MKIGSVSDIVNFCVFYKHDDDTSIHPDLFLRDLMTYQRITCLSRWSTLETSQKYLEVSSRSSSRLLTVLPCVCTQSEQRRIPQRWIISRDSSAYLGTLGGGKGMWETRVHWIPEICITLFRGNPLSPPPLTRFTRVPGVLWSWTVILVLNFDSFVLVVSSQTFILLSFRRWKKTKKWIKKKIVTVNLNNPPWPGQPLPLQINHPFTVTLLFRQ